MGEPLQPFHFVTDAFPDRIAQLSLYTNLGWKKSVATLDTILDVLMNAVGVSLPDYPLEPDIVQAGKRNEPLPLEGLAEIGRPLAIQYRGAGPFLEEDGRVGSTRYIALVYPVLHYHIEDQVLDVLALVTLDYLPLQAYWSLINAIVLFPIDPNGLKIMQHFQQSTVEREHSGDMSEPMRLPAMTMPLMPEAFAYEVKAVSEAVVRNSGIHSLFRGIDALQYTIQALRSPQFQVCLAATSGEENQARMAAGRPARLAENIVVRETLTARRSVSC